ncbi:hypothetical protein PSM36_1135 [Proteiniphilum saccharofermentans]|uniref:Secreted protein n=1 Tax=Proteiniphilum saccharofermentans TaxID=1642647 RepID=A0A1R3SYG8_9BACT|nr:hypothetical protein [Proteiniphilum saccharofermentans]SCD19960.1 hypothetical protein PSM36_1135 [Proteiniphilum saccharofermentans]SEA25493.1 hypothetical protein SAMN05216331_12930 [Porphyromonadaceae bacterium KH3R12]SFT09713.1 hypothetical protein SAMN05216365_1691 [Porphyromonadaceae bacterium NLAE-zl-C104]
MKELTKLLSVLLSISFMLIVSCQDNQILDEPKEDDRASVVSAQTRAVIPHDFDWENADWMPTPPGQSQIPSPWVGQGSLVSIYGLDVINDRRASDGWELMYNSFDPNASGPLANPYFVLYNKYRGLMRIFLYTTTQFYAPSSYLQDGISIISNHSTSLLNFIGKEIVDVSVAPTKSYSQIQPKPSDGSYPLGSNKWYMMQYELAYDPNLATIPYNQIQLNWSLSSYDVTEVNLGGGATGTINGTIGSASSTSSNIISELKNTGEVVGKGVLAGVGQAVINNNTIDSTGRNHLKLPNNIFKALSTGVNAALSAASGNIPGAVIGLLSGVFGGSSSGPTAASFNLNADISLKGTLTNAGSFPSTPISFWVPGTNIASNAVGYIPLYNKSLGVLNFKPGAPRIDTSTSGRFGPYTVVDPWNGQVLQYYIRHLYFPQSVDYSSYLILNPELRYMSTVEIKQQDYYVKYYRRGENPKYQTFELNPGSISWEEWPHGVEHGTNPPQEPIITEMGVRFTIEVKPQDDNIPPSIIYKTFKLD